MVWFHGGGFVVGSSKDFYGPGNLLDRDVILVTANYRLGVVGFFTLGQQGEDLDVQGNQGLWDQTEGFCQTNFCISKKYKAEILRGKNKIHAPIYTVKKIPEIAQKSEIGLLSSLSRTIILYIHSWFFVIRKSDFFQP